MLFLKGNSFINVFGAMCVEVGGDVIESRGICMSYFEVFKKP